MNGKRSLNTGAVDLRLTGDQTQRGSYVQRRRNQMAYGGIAGLDGRRRYGIGSWFQEKVKDPIAKLIPHELKNPVVAAVAANYLPTLLNKPTVLGQLGEKFPTVLGEDSMIGKGIEAVKSIPGNVMDVFKGSSGSDAEIDAIFKKPESDKTIEEKRKIEEWEIKNLGGQ